MAKAEKVTAVAEIAEQFRGATATVITEYRGLSVSNLTTLRRALGTGATYSVAKNTLVKRAAADAGVEGLDELFVGPTAITFIHGEPVDAAKALKTFAKDNKALVIKGGLLNDALLSPDEVRVLADLPSRDQLLAEIAGLFAAPMQQFAGLLDAVPRSFGYALNALIEAGGAPGAPEAAAAPETDAAPDEDAADEEAPADEAPAAEASPDAEPETAETDQPDTDTQEES